MLLKCMGLCSGCRAQMHADPQVLHPLRPVPDRRRLWKAAIKWPMYSVAVMLCCWQQVGGCPRRNRALGAVRWLPDGSCVVAPLGNLSNDLFDADTGVDAVGKPHSVVALLGRKRPVRQSAWLALLLGLLLMLLLALRSMGAGLVASAAPLVTCIRPSLPFQLSGLGRTALLVGLWPFATAAALLVLAPFAAVSPRLFPGAPRHLGSARPGHGAGAVLLRFHQVEEDAARQALPVVRLGTARAAADSLVVAAPWLEWIRCCRAIGLPPGGRSGPTGWSALIRLLRHHHQQIALACGFRPPLSGLERSWPQRWSGAGSSAGMVGTDGGVMKGMGLRLETRPYAFALTRPLQTAAGAWQQRRGWLLRITDGCGRCGWGKCLLHHSNRCVRRWLTERIHGAAFASVEVEQYCWAPAEMAFAAGSPGRAAGAGGGAVRWTGCQRLHQPSCCRLGLRCRSAGPGARDSGRWRADPQKVAAAADSEERRLLAWLLEALPSQARLRLDANGGWGLATAEQWAEALQSEPRLEWMEQPLAPDDLAGHQHLLARVPVALDEGLRDHPAWRAHWPGWQVRRPALEGDPRLLLRQLQQGIPYLMLSTAFETGIGTRWLAHLAALQQRGPTPGAPGLAPGWCPETALFSSDPEEVWIAAGDAR